MLSDKYYLEDPSKPTPEEIAAANATVRRLALKYGLMNAENMNVGNKIPPYVDLNGNILKPGSWKNDPMPSNMITDIRKMPPDIKAEDLKFNSDKNHWYFNDPQTGDYTPVSTEIASSSRFNPTRGTYDQSIVKK